MQIVEANAGEARSLGLLYALPGALGGLALWLLIEPFSVSRGVLAFAAPLLAFGIGAWTLVTTPQDRRRSALFAACLGLLLGGLGASAWVNFGPDAGPRAAIALPLIGWVGLGFYRSYQEAGHPAHYASLFATGWNLPVILLVAGAFTGAAYAVLWLLAGLFGLIGIEAFADMLLEPGVSMTLIGALGAAAIGVVRRQEAILLTLRGVAIALLRVLAPVFAFGTLLFAFALLVQGLDSLWDGWSPVVLIVLTIGAGIIFVNAVVRDEDAGTGLLGLAARVQCLVLPILAGLAAYGMWLRIDAHGLTPDRLLAAIIAGFAAVYAPIYAVAATLTGWQTLRGGNVMLAALLSLAAAWTLTPLFAANAWSVRDQIERLEAGRVAPSDFDYAALRFEFGEPGEAALRRLAEGDGEAARRAREALATEFPWQIGVQAAAEAALDALDNALVRPAGADLPQSFRDTMKDWPQPEGEDVRSVLLLMPLYDGARDAVLWVRRDGEQAWIEIALWIEADETAPKGSEPWTLVRRYRRVFDRQAAADAFMSAVETGSFGPKPVTILAPHIAGQPLLPEGRDAPILAPQPD